MMAVNLHRARELLLSPRFLADNNNNNDEAGNNYMLSNNNDNNSNSFSTLLNQTNSDFNVPNNNNGLQPPFDLSSPGSSSSERASFTETETDEEEEEEEDDDDYIAELTRQMAHYMFQDDDKKLNSQKIDKSWVGLGGRPHYSSVLCSPNHEIPKWDLREPSPPPTTPEIQKQRTNSACEIMGKLEQVKISDEVSKNSEPPPQQQFQSMLQNPSSTTKSVDNNQSLGFCSNQAPLNQIRAIQFYKLKQEQLLKQQTKETQHHPQFQKKNNRGYANGCANGVGSRPTPWVSQQQQNGSGMRAVFLGGSSSKSNGGSSGTGVFLPHVIGSTTTNQSRKKRGCSPVLIPAKVMQALRVHFDRMGHNISDLPEASNFPTLHESYRNSGGGRSSDKCLEKKRHSRAVPAMKRNEIGLPQEWTY